MRKVTRLLQIAVVIFAASLTIAAQKEWVGNYFFGEDGGKNAGGATIYISHQLDIFETDDGLGATIGSNGYQTSSNLNCTTKVEGTKLLIYFEGYGEDNMFEPYKPGDLLMTLERKTIGNKTVVLTYWGKFTASIPKNQKSGKVYFERSSEK